MLNKPDIIVADEPTGHLDPETGEGIIKLLRSICKDGTTVIMSTHNLSWLRLYPGRIFKFDDEKMTEIDENGNEIIKENAPEPVIAEEEKEEAKEEDTEVIAEEKEEETKEDTENEAEAASEKEEGKKEVEEKAEEPEEVEEEKTEEPVEEVKAEEKAADEPAEEKEEQPAKKERPTNIRTTITMGNGEVVSGVITDDYGFTDEELEQKTFNLNKHPRATFKGDGKFVAQSIYDLEVNNGVDVNKDLPIEKVEPKKRLSIPKN